jgi:GntR family transcriptional regulator/MocR family aminotransferase
MPSRRGIKAEPVGALDGLRVDPDSPIGLQSQIRQQLIAGIFAGRFQPGQRLPSSRQLARALGVARNTALLAYQELIAEGHIVARARSGLYLNETLAKGAGSVVGRVQSARAKHRADWSKLLKRRPSIAAVERYPCDWQACPYPFIEGCFDQSLFPRREWREASRASLSRRQIDAWSADSGDSDDSELIEQIRTKILPRRGIAAVPEEILITAGTEPALHLLSELLVDAATCVAIEEPGSIAMRELLGRRGARIVPQPVDDDGMLVDSRLSDCDLVYVTPSHQEPTAVTLSAARRAALLKKAASADFRIVEDDADSATNYLEDAPPALRAMRGGERVIYVADFSGVLAPAVRLGFLVAAPEIIAAARELRALLTRRPSLSNQRTMALLLSLGLYDAAMLRLGRIFRERLFALREALNHYLQSFIAIAPARGGTTYWVRGPAGIDAAELAREAALHGILIEPVADYFGAANPQRNLFRMGVTGIPVERVRAGVAALAAVLRDVAQRREAPPAAAAAGAAPAAAGAGAAGAAWLGAADLERHFGNARIESKTVYGDPYTIRLYPDGRMTGRAGHDGADRDQGRWWVEGDRWFRQWRSWAYGEPAGYFVRVQGRQLQLFNEHRRLVDALTLLPAEE